ncbi:hypothetical protein [Streptomyces iranensis]|uniref:Peptidoglycan/xylan/chitin deacetylase (PgdA/CDA1 family) n=1 Tax=Streptomyces iranensis TaxID=576784 RepID=A0A060ZP92_9ACTN|nr:hypothetical protein [Streptomyces iranensis]MBP2062153.1 peptidoglycan/xylan/chitin deacetylase (PgdA/CDA1 family) [Streptomyces iranensis]CDR07656.1 polysaccharide deacetylase [Streptomyces iranensis]
MRVSRCPSSVYEVDRPSTSIFPDTRALAPYPLNYGWRDYGPRGGIWRLIESLDRHQVRASVMLNSDVAERYPQIVRAGRERNWVWAAHGKNNSILQADMSPELGPALTETFRTPELLAELGLRYVLDWANDDQPYRLNVPGMLSVPY